MTPLQMFGVNPLGSIMLALIVPFVVVLAGTYLGTLGALQTFFGESSWQDVSTVEDVRISDRSGKEMEERATDEAPGGERNEA